MKIDWFLGDPRKQKIEKFYKTAYKTMGPELVFLSPFVY